MPRISGVDIPENKRVEVALRYLYGIGKYNSIEVLKKLASILIKEQRN